MGPYGPRFELLERLDSDGDTLLRVRDREIGEVVALHLLEGAEHLELAVKRARRISSPRVCRIHDWVELEDGQRALTTELLDGKPLSGVVGTGLGHSLKRAAALAADVAEGLGTAHAIGVHHGSLSAAQVQVDASDRAILLGFGTSSGGDPAGDLRALGLLLAEMIGGRAPAHGAEAVAMLERAGPRAYRLLGVVRALVQDPAPPSAFWVMEELRSVARGEEPILPAAPAPQKVAAKGTSAGVDRRLIAIVLAAILTAIAIYLAARAEAATAISAANRAFSITSAKLVSTTEPLEERSSQARRNGVIAGPRTPSALASASARSISASATAGS
jgi:hypothetical protein